MSSPLAQLTLARSSHLPSCLRNATSNPNKPRPNQITRPKHLPLKKPRPNPTNQKISSKNYPQTHTHPHCAPSRRALTREHPPSNTCPRLRFKSAATRVFVTFAKINFPSHTNALTRSFLCFRLKMAATMKKSKYLSR